MNKGWNLARTALPSRKAFRDILPITAVIWLANWAILVTRSYVLGVNTGWSEAAVRLAISVAGAGSCLLIYKLLQGREMTPPARFLAAFACSLVAVVVISLGHELLWLVSTDYYLKNYGFRPGDLVISQCGTASSPCQQLLSQAYFSVGTLIWVFVAWSAFYVGLAMTEELREREWRLHRAERMAQAAQLSALRLQLNPHFLFNTLNTLSGLIALDRKSQAENIVLNLSSFLRFSLKSDEEELVTVAKEIEAQKMYLGIEQVRFADRLTVHYDIDEDCVQATVPPLLLQPLVENAIKHAVSPADAITRLTISAKRLGDELILTVQNSACSGSDVARREGLGIGVSNIRNRLSALYGAKASLQAGRAADGGWVNVISLPWTEQLEDHARTDCG